MTDKRDIYSIHKLMGLKPRSDGYSHTGVYATGNFDGLFDYDAGILEVHISIYRSIFDPNPEGWTIMFAIVTIDDGVWQAPDIKVDYTKDEAIKRIADLAKAFNQFMDRSLTLPTEKEINTFLMAHALCGEYTG